MKNLKKLTSLLLALVMAFAMSATVFAVEADLTNHTYKAYQIFAGTQTDKEDDATLASIKWGTGVDGEKLLAAVKADKTIGADFTACTSAADVAKALSKYVDKSAEAEAFAKLAYANKTGEGAETGDSLAAGYYLVVDVTKDAEVYNLALLQLTKKGNFTIENKTDVPESGKKVDDENDSVVDAEGVDGEDTTNWQDSADYDIGDKVPFQLSGTVATNYDDYDTYYFTFHDVEENGLTFNNDVVVKVDGKVIESGYTVVTACEDDCTFEVVFTDLKKISSVKAGSVITVEYTSTLNEKAVVGNNGNVNKSRLEFSNNPNDEQGGESTGFTPWDNVIVFTYTVNVNKVDPNKKALAGAAFELQKYDAKTNEWVALKSFEAGADTSFEFKGLDAGEYKLVETVAPAGYNKIADVEFTVTANHEITWDGTNRTAVLTSLTGNVASGEITFTASEDNGSLTTDVVNQSGTTLPETGGIGTTMFYVIGAILVVGAAVVMITRKRMSR